MDGSLIGFHILPSSSTRTRKQSGRCPQPLPAHSTDLSGGDHRVQSTPAYLQGMLGLPGGLAVCYTAENSTTRLPNRTYTDDDSTKRLSSGIRVSLLSRLSLHSRWFHRWFPHLGASWWRNHWPFRHHQDPVCLGSPILLATSPSRRSLSDRPMLHLHHR